MKKIIAALLILVLFCASACAETLVLNDWNDDVKSMQQQLIDAGYLAGAADGIFGKGTQRAVIRFQYLNGLEPTGEFDEATAALLASGEIRTLRMPLQDGSKGEEVTALQERLILLGFMTAKADGVYGDKTHKAVKEFQEHLQAQGITEDDVSGVIADGEADGLTQEYLFSPTYTTYVNDILPGATEDSEIFRVERRLRVLGYMDASADHEYDEYAQTCVKAFQQASELEVTGTVDRATIDRLFSEDAAASEHFIPHDLAKGDSGQLVYDVQEVLIRYGFMYGVPGKNYGDDMENALERLYDYLAAAGSEHAPLFETREVLTVAAQELLHNEDLYTFIEAIEEGASKAEILRTQRRLHTLFYLDRTDLDGDYGQKTRTAIEEFQANNALEVTGIADDATQQVLFSADPVGDWTPYKLEISIDEQRVYVYELNEDMHYVQIDEFICSTGLGNSTPLGVFTRTQPLNRWHFFKDFNCWAQYSYQIEGNILFHSILYDERDTDTIRLNSVYALGSKASHGCVRLQPEDAKWIYENCKKGTIVVIY